MCNNFYGINMKYILCFLFCILKGCQAESDTLQSVHVIFRHGKRYPLSEELYTNDPYYEFLRPLTGQLTELGKNETCKLGNVLKSHYGGLVGNTYSSEVITLTSGTNRTIESAHLVLHGFFSNCDSEDKNLTNIFDITSNKYKLQQPRYFCPVYKNELEKFLLQNNESIEIIEKSKRLFDFIGNNTGHPYKSLLDVLILYGSLCMKMNLDLSTPQWVQEALPCILNLSITRLSYESGNNLLKRLNGGRVLKSIMNGLKEVTETSRKKLFLYSGHDYTIASILSTLDVFEPHYPNCSSAVAIELYRQNGNGGRHYVKVMYYKDLYSEPKELPLKDCGTSCDLAQFQQMFNHYIPMNYTKECESDILLD